ncbi:prepilin-type N-terminal cleavage/methylation domain-containing protein [Mycetocola sp. CAN_C7]|uniref:prepilin-type N-terminal cleavage/methylation domain-containing protein n=1 Tax=Mycetocola sp. CAN_C7 TaxID=2787724 RepID=UPI002FEFFD5D
MRASFPDHERDSGLTLIELIVAMMIFALIAAGISVSVTSVLSMTSGSRARVAATNLAASEIDLVRSYEDVFKVLTKSTTKTVDGTTFTVRRSTSWVSTAGTDVSCSSAGGALQYKRVNVKVEWAGNPGADVRSDTLLTPGSRINEPTTGTILVSVKAASGQGTPDVTISAVATASGGAITTTPPKTDADGCSYLLKVVPGTYKVAIAKAGNVDNLHSPSPTLSVTVLAGQSTAAAFAYDTAATYNVKYVATPAPAAALPNAIAVPTTVESSIFGGGVPVVRSLSSSMSLFPQPAGYQMVTGAFAVETATKPCTVVDPTAWLDDESVVPPRTGQLPGLVAATPPSSADIDVPVGVVTVKGDSNGSRYLFAERVTSTVVSPTGQPACAQPATYSFAAQIIPTNSNSLITVGLPFGSWRLYTSTHADGRSPIALTTTRVTVRTSAQPATGSSVFVLDPRAVAP